MPREPRPREPRPSPSPIDGTSFRARLIDAGLLSPAMSTDSELIGQALIDRVVGGRPYLPIREDDAAPSARVRKRSGAPTPVPAAVLAGELFEAHRGPRRARREAPPVDESPARAERLARRTDHREAA